MSEYPAERPVDWPAWVPVAARNYLDHTEGRQTIRALAREAQVAPSTILRRVRRVESSRDDPLVDAALRQLSDGAPPAEEAGDDLMRRAAPVLRRLIEPQAVLAVAREMPNGVIVRSTGDGEPQRLAVVEREVAEALVLRDWIAATSAPEARIARYRVTAAGKAALRRHLAEAQGFWEAHTPFLGADLDEDDEADDELRDDARLRHMRSLLPESPMVALSRRRDHGGRPFLPRELVMAGERLREDFELAQRADGPPPDWDALLADVARLMLPASASSGGSGRSLVTGPDAARTRIVRALADLGPGLADVALRCCCFLDGLEAVEKRMGWSARSGKIVLRIALERLRRHYAGSAGPNDSLIG